jgi:hypothetical protein
LPRALLCCTAAVLGRPRSARPVCEADGACMQGTRALVLRQARYLHLRTQQQDSLLAVPCHALALSLARQLHAVQIVSGAHAACPLRRPPSVRCAPAGGRQGAAQRSTSVRLGHSTRLAASGCATAPAAVAVSRICSLPQPAAAAARSTCLLVEQRGWPSCRCDVGRRRQAAGAGRLRRSRSGRSAFTRVDAPPLAADHALPAPGSAAQSPSAARLLHLQSCSCSGGRADLRRSCWALPADETATASPCPSQRSARRRLPALQVPAGIAAGAALSGAWTSSPR